MGRDFLPRQDIAVADQSGRMTTPFYVFLQSFQRLVDAGVISQGQYDALVSRVAKLEDAPSIDASIQGVGSIVVYGSLSEGFISIGLQNDTVEKGLTWYYGSGPDGEPGWYPIADAVDVTAGELTKSVDDETGVTTFGLADVADAGGGTLQRTAFDAKGRKIGTSAATTDDLDEGATNLYFTDERASEAAPIQSVVAGTNVTVDATDPRNPVINASGGGGSGTVTSVNLSVPTGFSASGGPITSGGTLTVTYSAGYQGYTSAEATKLSGIAAGATDNTGTVTSINLGSSTGLTPSGGPVTGSGTLTYTLSANLQAWHALAPSSKEPAIAAGTTAQYWRGDKSWQALNKTVVGLGNVDNTPDADAGKRTLTATQINTAIALVAANICTLMFRNAAAGALTIPTGVAGAGNWVVIINNVNSNMTITQGSGVTLRLAGTTTAGNRTLAPFSVATITWISGAIAFISGDGVT